MLDEQEMRFYHYGATNKLNHKNPIPKRDYRIYVCPYFPEDPTDRELNPQTFRFDVDWKDRNFKRIAKEMIAPKRPLALTVPPRDTVNVAIHIREGGGYDTDHTKLWDPLKLPPIHFYTDALKQVLTYFPEKKIYCYLFTDAIEPALLAEKFDPEGRVEFDFRKENNRHDANVLEDFFSFFEFDVLIHPQSNYSVVAAGIGEFVIDVAPVQFNRNKEEMTITITEMKIDLNEELYKQVLKRLE